MKCSIIVPIFNAEKTLERCVDSLLAQTFEDFELILVDDGSTDRSLSICEAYKEKERERRIVVATKDNGGASSARNVGLKIASGEWINFCDSDDYVKENWLSSFVDNINGAELVIQGFDAKGYSPELFNDSSFFDGALSAPDALLNLFKNKLLGYNTSLKI